MMPSVEEELPVAGVLPPTWLQYPCPKEVVAFVKSSLRPASVESPKNVGSADGARYLSPEIQATIPKKVPTHWHLDRSGLTDEPLWNPGTMCPPLAVWQSLSVPGCPLLGRHGPRPLTCTGCIRADARSHARPHMHTTHASRMPEVDGTTSSVAAGVTPSACWAFEQPSNGPPFIGETRSGCIAGTAW